MLPIFKIVLFWVIGILLIPYNPFSQDEIIIALVVIWFLFIGVSKWFTKPKFIGNILVVLVLIGAVQLQSTISKSTSSNKLIDKSTCTVAVKVESLFKQVAFYNKYIVEVESSFGDSILCVKRNYLLVQRTDSLTQIYLPGSRFIVDVHVSDFPSLKHHALFDSKRFWNLKGVDATLWVQDNMLYELEPSLSLYYRIRRLQIKWIELIKAQNITDESKEILAALLLGDKRGVSKDIYGQFSRLGLVHTLALSGLHISLVYGVGAFLLSFLLRNRPRLQSVVLVLLIIAYAVLTGLSPSVMRASLMFLLYAFSLLINRRTTAINIVFLSAFILLVYNSNLLYDLGFQLSYLAVIGIVYFYNKFKKYLENRSLIIVFVLGLALVSISAQLSTGLLSAYYFHSFPLSFLWANLLILPLITLLLYAGLLYLVLLIMGLQFDLFDQFIIYYVECLLSGLSFLEQYSFAPIELYLSHDYVLCLYGLLLLFCLVFVEKKFKFIRGLYIYILLASLYFMDLNKKQNKAIYINSSKKGYVISVINGQEQVLISNNHQSSKYLIGSYALEKGIRCTDTLGHNEIYKNEFCFLKDNSLQFFDQELVIVGAEKINLNVIKPIDVLMLQSSRADCFNLNKVFSPKVVLLSAEISTKQRKKLVYDWEGIGVFVVDLNSRVFTKEL